MMSVMESKLTKQQEIRLRSLFGQARLSLLFKASVHGFNANAFHQKCDFQGPTVTVAYNTSGYIFGAFTSQDYAQTGRNIADEKAFLFSFNQRDVGAAPLRVVSTEEQRAFVDGSTGPNFVSMVFLYNNTATVGVYGPGTYNYDPIEMYGDNLQLSECEVYRVEGFGSLMEKPWRNIEWSSKNRKSLVDMLNSWTPSVSLVQKARVLLLGPVGAGKSSFFNSINSVFKGYVSCQANTGTAGTSLTTQFRVYPIKVNGKCLPLTLCDSMGLEEGPNAGLDMDDFTNILKGHIQDRYQFNASVPLQTDSSYYCKSPAVKDRIHTVVFVMDACKIKLVSEKMSDKLAAFRRKANHMGIPQIVFLTKVDEACRLVGEDLTRVYQSHYIHRMMQEVSLLLGVSLSAVVPVKNYSKELELDINSDVLLLSAVLQILRCTEAYCDDFVYNTDTDNSSSQPAD